MADQRSTKTGAIDKRYGPRDPNANIPKLNGGKPADVRGLTRVVRRNLAAVIRERLDPEQVTEWLLACWLDGAMPPRPEARRKPGAHAEPEGLVPLSFAERSRALELLLLRGFGQPTSHVVLDAEVRALVQVDEGAARQRLAELPAQKRQELARMIREVLGRSEHTYDPHRHETAGVLPPPTIDASSRELEPDPVASPEPTASDW